MRTPEQTKAVIIEVLDQAMKDALFELGVPRFAAAERMYAALVKHGIGFTVPDDPFHEHIWAVCPDDNDIERCGCGEQRFNWRTAGAYL